jgi:hypothetical protein
MADSAPAGMHPLPGDDFAGIARTIDDWLELKIPDRAYLLGSVFTTTTRALISAETGLGKTHVGCAIGWTIGLTLPFCHWTAGTADREVTVLIVDGEMPQELVKERITDCIRRHGKPPSLQVICKEQIEDMPPLDSPEGQLWVDDFIAAFGPFDFIIFDNIMSLTASDLRDEEGWKALMPWIKSLTARRIGQLWINHTGHDKTRDYGTSTRVWQFDTAMIAEKVDDPNADIAFRLSFPKARLRTPDTRQDYAPHIFRLVNDQWSSLPANQSRSQKPKKPPDGFATALEALDHALATAGQRRYVTPRGPNVICATVDQWRDEMKCRGLFALDDKKHLTNKDRSDFARIKKHGSDTYQLAVHEPYVWRI